MRPDLSLSLEQAPPISVPFRFFLSVPFFGLVASTLLLWRGGDALATRWTPEALALAHLMALGVVGMSICGALMQMLPVMVGVSVPAPRLTAGICHVLVTAGTLLLALAFMDGGAGLFRASAIVLGAGLAVFLALFGYGLLRAPRIGEAVRGMCWVWLGLAVTVALGVALALAHAEPGLTLYRPVATDVHLAFGLLGWVALLIVVVSWLVVPMFQMTPTYPAWLRTALAPLVLAALVWLAFGLAVRPGQALPPAVVLAALFSAYAVVTLRLLARRRRARSDASFRLWQFGLAMLILAALAGLWPFAALPGLPETLPATLFLTGFALSIILAMLMKIMPFLAWLHLQQRLSGRPEAMAHYMLPGMKTLLPEAGLVRLAWAHGIACLMLAGAQFQPSLIRPAALAWVVVFLLLGSNQLVSVRAFRRECRRMAAACGQASGERL